MNGAEELQVVQDLQKAGTKRSVNGIGQPGGDPHYYSCQKEPRILFLDQQIRAIPWTYPRLCQGILFNSRQQFQVKSATICTPHGMGFPSGLWLLAFWAVSRIHWQFFLPLGQSILVGQISPCICWFSVNHGWVMKQSLLGPDLFVISLSPLWAVLILQCRG